MRGESNIGGSRPAVRGSVRGALAMAGVLIWLAGAGSAAGQAPASGGVNFAESPTSFPRIFEAYQMRQVPGPNLENSAALAQQARGGTLQLSLKQMLDAVVENNLGLAAARYNLSMAETDLLRAR